MAEAVGGRGSMFRILEFGVVVIFLMLWRCRQQLFVAMQNLCRAAVALDRAHAARRGFVCDDERHTNNEE